MPMSIEMGSSSSSSSGGASVDPTLFGGYQNLLGLNQNNYSNILGAYSGGASQLQGNLSGIYPGYGALTGQIKDTLGLSGGGWGVAAPAAEAIKNAGIAEQGKIGQQMTNQGLGNTTVSGNMANQANYFTQQAYGGLGAQLAQTFAGYQSQLGLAGLGARMQGAGMQSGLAQNLGSTLGHYSFGNTMGNLTNPHQNSTSHSQNQGVGGGGLLGGGMGPINHNDGLGGGGGGYASGILGSPSEGGGMDWMNPAPPPVQPAADPYGGGNYSSAIGDTGSSGDPYGGDWSTSFGDDSGYA
jgi:hypothetical protein